MKQSNFWSPLVFSAPGSPQVPSSSAALLNLRIWNIRISPNIFFMSFLSQKKMQMHVNIQNLMFTYVYCLLKFLPVQPRHIWGQKLAARDEDCSKLGVGVPSTIEWPVLWHRSRHWSRHLQVTIANDPHLGHSLLLGSIGLQKTQWVF